MGADSQILISISRTYGSGGHAIAAKIAEDFGLPLYDRNLLEHMTNDKVIKNDFYQTIDDRPHIWKHSRSVRGYSNSLEENLLELQFDYLRKKADAGESFVIVGRCSETALAGRPGLVSVFVNGDSEARLSRIMEIQGLNKREAAGKIKRVDNARKAYHNKFGKGPWGDSRGYDLCINSTRLGIEGTAQMLEKYIEARREM